MTTELGNIIASLLQRLQRVTKRIGEIHMHGIPWCHREILTALVIRTVNFEESWIPGGFIDTKL